MIPEGRIKQAIVINKSLASSADQARAIAKEFGTDDKIDETGQSFRFRQIDPKKIVPGTFRTFKPKEGVAIVYGELKKKKGVAAGLNRSLKKPKEV